METKKLKFSVIMLSVVVVVLMGIAISVAEAQGEGGGVPVLPCAFYGNVTIDGNPAPVETEITAIMDNKTCGTTTVIEEGKYGKAPGERLTVPGSAADENKILSFYVNGTKAEEEGAWNSGGVKHLDLSVKKAGSSGNGNEEGAAASAIPYTVLIILLIVIVIVVVAVAVWRRRKK